MLRGVLTTGLRCAILVLIAVAARQAPAVVISSNNDALNVIAPAGNPGWSNVGHVGGASAVYLGNRWVITAEHVGQSNLRLSDGRQFAESIGSNVQLTNAGVAPFGAPDLRIFRLAEDPGLPSLSIAATSPGLGSPVMMIGAGANRSEQSIGWQLTATENGPLWTQVPIQNASVQGYSLLGTRTMRWGMNFVSAESDFRPSDTTQIFMTRYDQPGTAFEAQATPGDSGGGVFLNSLDGWQLAGLMITTQPLLNQPSDTVVFGQGTAIADLAAYRNQILSFVDRAEPLWQNQVNHYDVSGTGGVTTRDIMFLVNQLLRSGNRDLFGSPGSSEGWLDVNGDYRLSTADVFSVVNQILRQRSLAPAAAPLFGAEQFDVGAVPLSATYVVPEPATGTLAIVAALLAGWAVRRRARQRSGR